MKREWINPPSSGFLCVLPQNAFIPEERNMYQLNSPLSASGYPLNGYLNEVMMGIT
jgi:hypothetical protein